MTLFGLEVGPFGGLPRPRIERKLNRVDGVIATVNYATEQAHVTFGAGVTADEVIGVVEQMHIFTIL